MKATIYYTATNVSGYYYGYDASGKKVEVRHYDRDGKFLRRTSETPRLDHYTKVAEVEFPLGNVREVPTHVDKAIPNRHLEAIYKYANMVLPSEVTRRVKEEGLETEHSSMSVGDMIEIDGHYFMVDRVGFNRETFNS